MKPLAEKVFLQLNMPSEEETTGDRERISQALADRGYRDVSFSLELLRELYPSCRQWEYRLTVTLVQTDTGWRVTAIEPGDSTGKHYGLAVDYGSTTVVMQLVDLNSGAVIDEGKTVNGQVEFGTDILTRITYGMEVPLHRDELQKVTVNTFETLMEQLTEQTGIEAEKCPVMVLSGNTTMIHFLLKLDAWTVFASPYAPVASNPGWFSGRELGMKFEGLVYIVPAASNYVGGDIVSGLMYLGIHRQEKVRMFFDIGTNGELVIGNREWMLAGAGAAGPALEGYISRYGMRAAPGAVDTVRIRDGQLSVTTVGGEPPRGICGSGIIDLLAQMRLNGWMDISGELNRDASDRIIYLESEKQLAVVYAQNPKLLFFTQTDIRQYLDTKAAAYTMIECLLEAAGCEAGDIDKCWLSGAFTAHSDLEAAITVGMFPDLERSRYECVSNTSLEGARVLLLNRQLRQEAESLAEKIYCVQFASIPDFLVRMQAAKFVPHTDMNRYPSIRAKLKE